MFRPSLLLAAALAGPAHALDLGLERFRDPQDGAIDLSDWLLKQKGFLPVPLLITEPAVGYGGGVAVAFFRESIGEAAAKAKETGRMQPPDIYALAAVGTENGTWGLGGGGMVSFDDDAWRWRGAIGRANIELDFYGHGGRIGPLGYQLEGVVSVQHLMYRLGRSDEWLVARWNYLDLTSTFDPGDLDRFGPLEMARRSSGLGVSWEHDSRDTIFTPTKGWTGSIDLTFYDDAVGSDTTFQSYRGKVFAYWQTHPTMVVAARGDLRAVEGDAPFYMLPYVDLRGVPAMRVQDTRTAVAELELRWTVVPRWGLVGFAGGGRAWGRSDGTNSFTKGVGFRYELARQMGLWAGIDWAWSTQDNAWYVQVGNAWR